MGPTATVGLGEPAQQNPEAKPKTRHAIEDASDGLLTTDPRDVACEETSQLIDAYAELVLAGDDPEQTLPVITVHMSSCNPCAEDYRGLLHAMRAGAGLPHLVRVRRQRRRCTRRPPARPATD